ncbi:hypothetical protein LTR50_001558 [Elasticomyces elasticus]|nr:hypothetical protein LTR50_001558 [Elasticomyces elasticus]
MSSGNTSSYQVTEPHPSVPRSSYIHAGRGGAGNYQYYSRETLTAGPVASGPASRAVLSPPPTSSRVISGRGGAGNAHAQSQRAIFSFDEELERQRKMLEHQAPVYHIGRGGAGNAVDEMVPRRGSRLGSTGSVASNASDASEKARKSFEGAWNRVSRTFSRQ